MKSIKSLLYTWKIFKSLEIGTILFASYSIFNVFSFSLELQICLLMFVTFGLIYLYGIFNKSQADVVDHLNSVEKDFEFSSQLLLKETKNLNTLEKLQYDKLISIIHDKQLFQIRPNYLRIILSVIISISCFYIGDINSTPLQKNPIDLIGSKSKESDRPFSIESIQLHNNPPAYTRLKPSIISSLNGSVSKYATLQWELKTSDAFQSAFVEFTNGESFPIKSLFPKASLSNPVQLFNSIYYRIKVITTTADTLFSEFGKLQRIDDKRPRIIVDIKESYMTFNHSETKSFTFNTIVQDDYGIRDVRLIATVSRGKGESIKFREEEVKFRTFPMTQTTQNHQTMLDFESFKMEPGDELYFYIIATDNNPFTPGITKTETYYIALEDTATDVLLATSAISVNQMPAYFRSQRQIIIDTEKLIKDKPNLSEDIFYKTGNEIGYDQKILRLKYGQFLGEENESVEYDPEAEEELDDHHEGDGHNHESILNDKMRESIEKVLAPFIHTHDVEAQANFFEPRLKIKMKKILGEMWGSELYLRLGKPKDALPFQYRALKLLKEIKYESRIYVERIGFEAPSINEKEARLTKKDKAPKNKFNTTKHPSETFDSFQKFSHWLHSDYNKRPFNSDHLATVVHAFSSDLINETQNRINELSSLTKVKKGDTLSDKERTQLQQWLLDYIDQNFKHLTKARNQESKLDKTYRSNLGSQK